MEVVWGMTIKMFSPYIFIFLGDVGLEFGVSAFFIYVGQRGVIGGHVTINMLHVFYGTIDIYEGMWTLGNGNAHVICLIFVSFGDGGGLTGLTIYFYSSLHGIIGILDFVRLVEGAFGMTI